MYNSCMLNENQKMNAQQSTQEQLNRLTEDQHKFADAISAELRVMALECDNKGAMDLLTGTTWYQKAIAHVEFGNMKISEATDLMIELYAQWDPMPNPES